MDDTMSPESGVLTSPQVLLTLERILMGRRFVQSSRLSHFLRFAVERTLKGKASELKEYAIATEVYDRKDDFDPTLDTIVRSEARRLRRKLKEYYDTEGKGDPVVIDLRPGSYVPVHRARSVFPVVANSSEEEFSVAVEAFECDGDNALSRACAFGIADEILHHLAHFPGIRVIGGLARTSVRDACAPDGARQSTHAGLVIWETVRLHDNLLRVTARATTADRRLLCSHRIDSTVGDTALINLQEMVATDVLHHIGPWLFGPRLLEIASDNLPFQCLPVKDSCPCVAPQ
jgi:TolB-like protein